MGSTDRKSYYENVVYSNGDRVAWFTHKQPVLTASSTEAEYIALSDTCKDGLGLYDFINEFIHVDPPMQMHMDNRGAMFMTNNLVTTKKSKHIDLRKHMT